MSKSFKKIPICLDKTGKKYKKLSNKIIRRYNRELVQNLHLNNYDTDAYIGFYVKEIPNGNIYKHVFQSWDICDWKIEISFEEYLDFWNIESNKESYRDWYTRYIMK